MLITWRPILACRLCLAKVVLGGGFVSPAHAADGERGISIYDKYPECMRPDELKPEERNKCVIQDGPPHRPIPAGKQKDKGSAPASRIGTREGAVGNTPASASRPAGTCSVGGR